MPYTPKPIPVIAPVCGNCRHWQIVADDPDPNWGFCGNTYGWYSGDDTEAYISIDLAADEGIDPDDLTFSTTLRTRKLFGCTEWKPSRDF